MTDPFSSSDMPLSSTTASSVTGGPLVQWNFLQLKKSNKKSTPVPCFLQSSTQIGSKILIYGGCNYHGDPLNQLFLYDTITYQWNLPNHITEYHDDSPGIRYGHSMTLIDMHPPRLLLYGGMIGLVSYEFDDDKRLHAGGIQQGGYAGDDSGRVMSSSDANTNSFSASASLTTSSSPPSSPGQPSDGQQSFLIREFMNRRRKGKSRQMTEEPDNGVYFLELNSDTWKWSKPLIPLKTNGTKNPRARAEHSASKIPNSNQILFFGGWVDCPSNELWVFDFMDLEWNEFVTSGISPRARYRHTSEILNGKYYILGGSDNAEDVCDGKSYLSIHELNFETLQWYHPELRGGNPFPRSGHSSSVIGAHSIVVFGGKRSEEVFFNDIVIIDTESYSLTTVNVVENAVPSPITNASLSAIGNTCYVFGGTDLNGACFNDIRFVDLTEYLDERDITVGEGAASDYSFKILIIGDAAVGKSALLTRFSENVFLDSYTSTIGIDFNSRMIRVGGSICKLEIWDTAGQERFSTITANYYRGAQGALLVYDIGRRESFEHVRSWYERAKQLGGQDIEPVLIGNKSDLSRSLVQVSFQEGEALAMELGIPFLETSALSGENVESAFVKMTTRIKASVDRRGVKGVSATGMSSAGGVVVASGDRQMTVKEKCGCN